MGPSCRPPLAGTQSSVLEACELRFELIKATLDLGVTGAVVTPKEIDKPRNQEMNSEMNVLLFVCLFVGFVTIVVLPGRLIDKSQTWRYRTPFW